ncbi:hypothetical protein G7Y79_00001g003660 [Physcia stellaris]|nr:hypothetical protein G7Y79_00001g003660 [Physcia stellaris]
MVKWTSELDQMLLVKVLKACEVRPTMTQYQAMAASWPEHLERPTDRAISEHLFVLRKKANATMGKAAKASPEMSRLLAISKSTSKKDNFKVNEGTPKKTPPKAKAGGKRKRVDNDDESTSNDGVSLAPKPENPSTPTTQPSEFPKTFTKSRAAATPSNPSKSTVKPAPKIQNGGLMYDGGSESKGWVKLEDGLEMEAI